MSDAPRFDLPPELERLLQQLRGRIRKYVLLEGVALTLAALAGLFWISFGLDHAWFAVSRLELPVWFRATFDVVVLSVVAFLIVTWVGLRLFRSFRFKALALVLERRFPQAVVDVERNVVAEGVEPFRMLHRLADAHRVAFEDVGDQRFGR